MARPLRIEYPGAWYHVMNRVAGRGLVFKECWTKNLFLQMLQDMDHRFDVECHAYCLMGNHYHLLLRTPEGNLGRAMRHFSGLFTQHYNRHLRKDGPLFRGRYKAILVDADSYLLAVSRYIHRNPLEAGIVRKLDSYAGSSYPAYVGQAKAPHWLKTDFVLDILGSKKSQYRQFVEQPGPDEVTEFFRQGNQGPILGSSEFIKRALRGHRPNREQPRRDHRMPGAGEILDAVAKGFGVTTAELRHTPRGRGRRNIPRAIAMYLCQVLAQKKLEEIATQFNVGHYATVSVTIKRLKDDLETDGKLARQVRELEEGLR
jgi:putative transposase